MPINFKKMHGLGNDFVVLDTLRQKVNITPDLVQRMAHRFTGIGCDQVLIISQTEHPEADFAYTIYNADGSTAGQCGNGARCVARFAYDEQLTDKKALTFATKQHLTHTQILDDKTVRVALAIPDFQASRLPMQLPTTADYTLDLNGEAITFQAVSVGNPHVVLQVADLNTAPVQALGTAFNADPHFPEGVNVSFCQIQSPKQIALRVFERGAGETQACGSAACASMVCLHQQGLIDANVQIHLPGGQLGVAWAGMDQYVYLTGDAKSVFDGIYHG